MQNRIELLVAGGLCALGVEANPVHEKRLRALESCYKQQGSPPPGGSASRAHDVGRQSKQKRNKTNGRRQVDREVSHPSRPHRPEQPGANLFCLCFVVSLMCSFLDVNLLFIACVCLDLCVFCFHVVLHCFYVACVLM